jgi:hypothetical protein
MHVPSSPDIFPHFFVLTFFRIFDIFPIISAFRVDVGSGEILENRTLIPASASILLHSHRLLCETPFRSKWTSCTGTGTGMHRETV